MANQNDYEFKITQITCNQAQHQGKPIEAMCLNPGCKETPALCSKCGFNNHPQCRGQLIEIDEISQQLMGLRQFQLDIVLIQQKINQQFRELLTKIEQILSPITKYQRQPNLTNLIEIGLLLRKQIKQTILQSIEGTKNQIKVLLENPVSIQQINQDQQRQASQDESNSHAMAWFEKGDIYINLGVELHIIGQYNEAIHCFDKAIQINPLHFKSWFQKGDSLRFIGQYSQAVDCLDQAISINPKHLESWISKGNSLELLGRFNESIQCYEQCNKIEPKSTESDLKRVTEILKNIKKQQEMY